MKKKIQLFDTTLRDGTQAEQVNLSVDDKIRITERLDEFGIDYIEGGWPGSNPKDMAFFNQIKRRKFNHAKMVAFGSTRRKDRRVDDDPNLQAILEAETPAVAIFGKSWLLHVKKALKISEQDNLKLIGESVEYLKSKGREVIYDAEHFFDGYKDNPDYAIKTCQVAADAGADVVVLCDTNGGTMTSRLIQIVEDVIAKVNALLGIHAHNDSGLGVANTLMAVEAGCVHVHGTINGYGERCGNANLCEIIPNLQIKMGYECLPDENLKQLTSLAYYVSELANLAHPTHMPFVGRSAFAHKGGIHVSAVMKDAKTYEHINPTLIGNTQRVLVSDLAGRSNVLYKAKELNLDLKNYEDKVPAIVEQLKTLENEGYVFEAAESSFELLVKKMTSGFEDFFELEGIRVLIEKNENEEPRSEATVRLKVNGIQEHTAAEGVGPVNALDRALRKALVTFYPAIEEMHLSDYKVRVLNAEEATEAKVRVLILSATKSGDMEWSTVGVSENIIEASWRALVDSVSYFLMRKSEKSIHKK